MAREVQPTSPLEAEFESVIQSVPEVSHVAYLTTLGLDGKPTSLTAVLFGEFNGYNFSAESVRKTSRAHGLIKKLVPNIPATLGYVDTRGQPFEEAYVAYQERLSKLGGSYELSGVDTTRPV